MSSFLEESMTSKQEPHVLSGRQKLTGRKNMILISQSYFYLQHTDSTYDQFHSPAICKLHARITSSTFFLKPSTLTG